MLKSNTIYRCEGKQDAYKYVREGPKPLRQQPEPGITQPGGQATGRDGRPRDQRGKCGLRQVSRWLLSTALPKSMPMLRPLRQDWLLPDVLELQMLYVQARGAQVLRDLHHRNDHCQQSCSCKAKIFAYYYFNYISLTLCVLLNLFILQYKSTWCVQFYHVFLIGHRRCAPARTPYIETWSENYGQSIHCDLCVWDVCQTNSIWLQEILHRCLVLARFCHCDCKYTSCAVHEQNFKITLSYFLEIYYIANDFKVLISDRNAHVLQRPFIINVFTSII